MKRLFDANDLTKVEKKKKQNKKEELKIKIDKKLVAEFLHQKIRDDSKSKSGCKKIDVKVLISTCTVLSSSYG